MELGYSCLDHTRKETLFQIELLYSAGFIWEAKELQDAMVEL